MIPALSFVPLSDVESAFSKVTDEICVTADEFDIPTEILEKIDELATHFPKIYIKEETIGRQQRDFLDPPRSMEPLQQRGGRSQSNYQWS